MPGNLLPASLYRLRRVPRPPACAMRRTLRRASCSSRRPAPRRGCAQRAVGIEQFDAGARERRERLPEKRREEQVCCACADDVGAHSQPAHDVDAVAEGVGDALLRGAQDVRRGVAVEVQPDDSGSGTAVAEHPFGSVAERYDQHSFGACRHACGQPVHLRVVERLLRDIAAYPRIHDARAVDAEQNAVTGIAGRVIDVDEGIHARLRVGLAFVRDAVYHAARAARRGDFARLHDVERKGVVGLVPGAVGDRGTCGDAQQPFGRFVRAGLRADRDAGFGDRLLRNAVPSGHEVGPPFLFEVPEYLLRKAADGGGHASRKAVGDVVAGEHEFVYLREYAGFVAPYPRQFRRSEVAR